MALVTKDFSINITPGEMPPIIHVSEYDIGRAYNVTLIGENGSAFEIPTGTTATVEGTLNGTIGFTTSATISNNQISFALTESMTAYSGNAWCKIKLTLNSEPIQTCAFILAVDRAGVEADTVIGADGFEQQIVNAVNDWLDEHPPASGGMTEAFKQALLDCFENVAWINDQGQTCYDALYNALYPPADVLSISAVFNQGSAVIYDTDSLDTLKQYLVVTATMTDSTTRTVTDYTLSGTLAVGTSTITVLYNGKTDTFDVTVTAGLLPSGYTMMNGVHGNGSAYVKTNVQVPLGYSVKVKARAYAAPSATANIVGADRINPFTQKTVYLAYLSLSASANWIGSWYGSADCFLQAQDLYSGEFEAATKISASGIEFTLKNASGTFNQTASLGSSQNPSDALHLSLFYNGNASAGKFTGDILGVEVLDDSNNTSETFIPAKRDSDNVVGFYAVTEGVFYTSDTSTPFTAVA